MRSSLDLSSALRRHVTAIGFDLVGITPLRDSDHAAFYQRWLAGGRHGDMGYLARADAVQRRLRPTAAWPGLRSAIVVAHNYYAGGEGGGEGGRGIIARYARGRDYHKVIRQKLLELLRWLEGEIGHELPLARAYIDTGPVLERELAQRAGLGWFGRNTMLIHPRRGSYFFLGVLLVELELDYDEPFGADHCGTCTRCIDACPTGALLDRDADGAPVIDATRCISYLTIEHGGAIPRELRPLIGNRIFGCDICQEVCPFNGPKFVQIAAEPAYAARRAGAAPRGTQGSSAHASHPGTTSPSLIALMGMDETSWDAFSRGSALRRAGRAGFLRNVAVALGNWGSPEAAPALAAALSDREPLVRGHAAWALGRIASAEARAALSDQLAVESDAWVREELRLALDD
ncbi:MAG: tRNA epoxyqueuosine(34) reductase QueG [Longimicrobiales bacterium]